MVENSSYGLYEIAQHPVNEVSHRDCEQDPVWIFLGIPFYDSPKHPPAW